MYNGYEEKMRVRKREFESSVSVRAEHSKEHEKQNEGVHQNGKADCFLFEGRRKLL